MKTIWPRLALLCAALLLLAGCATSARLAGISTRLETVRLGEPGPAGQTPVTVTIRYVNENLSPIAISRSRHKLQLNGSPLGEIDSSRPVGMPARDSVLQEFSLDVPSSRLATLPLGQGVTYRIETIADIIVGANDMQSRSQESGTVALTR